MYLSKKPARYIIPEYSLTGDLLAYLTCGLQYRYHSKGSLPPSTPVQLWFGEFIHNVMEEAYQRWKQNKNLQRFPWSWDPEIRDIELEIDKRLRAKGLFAPPPLFCPYTAQFPSPGICGKPDHPHEKIASKRVRAAINTWGLHLFPLIQEAEVKLKGIRQMPKSGEGHSRSKYYGVNGVIDVISSFNLQTSAPGNLILDYLSHNPQVQKTIKDFKTKDYEIIIDYKGMRRPTKTSGAMPSGTWAYHEWQIRTYAWLRSLDPQSKPIAAGILFYLNELEPSYDDYIRLNEDVLTNQTDILPTAPDADEIANWNHRRANLPQLSGAYREARSIRIVPCESQVINHSLQQFDNVVGKIEDCVIREMNGNAITSSWNPTPEERNCTACDFKTYCPNPAPAKYAPTAP